MHKLNQRAFTLVDITIIVTVLIIVSVIGAAAWFRQSRPPDSVSKQKLAVSNWIFDNKIQSRTIAAKEDGVSVVNAAKLNARSELQAACQKLTDDIKETQKINSGPDDKLNKELQTAVESLASAANNCLQAITTNDSNAVSNAGSQTVAGLQKLAAFVNDARPFADKFS